MSLFGGWYNTVLVRLMIRVMFDLTDAILNPLFKSERGDTSPIGQSVLSVLTLARSVTSSSAVAEGIRKGDSHPPFENSAVEVYKIDCLVKGKNILS